MPLPLRTPVRIGQTMFELYSPQHETLALDERLISYREQAMTSARIPLAEREGTAVDDTFIRENRQLAAIYRLQSLLAGNLNEKELYHRILELITDVVYADNAYLLSWSEKEKTMIPVAERNQFGPVELVSDDYLSYSIISYVRDKSEAILSVDALNDQRFTGESLCGINVRSVMCVPMLGQQALCGMIYVISTKPERRYRETELKLLNVIAHSAGMAIENMRLIEQNIQTERMAAIGMTAAGLSHCVKNVLNGLEGSVSLLRLGIDGNDTELMNQSWDILNRNHKRLSTLVLDLLNLARDDQLTPVVCNLSELILEAVELVRAQAQQDNLAVDVSDNVRQTPIQAEVDNRGIHRVLLNLINNAIDAVREKHLNSGEGRVLVGAAYDPARRLVEIVVSDNGIGIPPEEMGHLFETFHTRKGDLGTGLGLAVSKRIVERHKGQILVESSLDSGSVFRILLPASQAVDITQTIKLSMKDPLGHGKPA